MRGAVDEARRLHGEGGRARADAAAAQVFAQRADDGARVDAVVLVVAAVFVVEQERGVVGGQGAGRQAAFAVTLGLVPRIVVASLSGYAAGQLLNAWLLTLMKDRLGERGLWKRLLGSTVVGEFGDTLIFCLIAAPVIGISTVGDTANYVVVGFVWKTLVEVAVMPITYLVIRRIKAHE